MALEKLFQQFTFSNLKILKRTVNTLTLPTPIKLAFLKNEPRILDHQSNSVLIYHGLFGNKINWKTLSRKISEQTKRIVYTLDCRDHGESEKSDELTYFAMAADTFNFMNVRKLNKVTLIGHSLGGRAFMQFAFLFPEKVEKLIFIDIGLDKNSINSKPLISYANQMKQALSALSSNVSFSDAKKQIDSFLKLNVPVSWFLLS